MIWIESGQREKRPLSTYWLITPGDGGNLQPTITGCDSDKTLPVFGFEEEAEMFLEFAGFGDGRRIRRTTAGELLFILLGPCKELRWASFDPLPGIFAKSKVDPSRMERERFMAFLTGETGVRTIVEVECSDIGGPLDDCPNTVGGPQASSSLGKGRTEQTLPRTDSVDR